MASAVARERFAKKNEASDLLRAFHVIDTKKDEKVDSEELNQLFARLGHKIKRSQVEEMIWEVDEDCDHCLTWAEFQSMYHRCNNDKTGFEPRTLFNVVQFVMNDREGMGRVSLEEAMQILYLRYGRQLLDAQLEEIFGTCDLNSGKTLTLTEFLTSLHILYLRYGRQLLDAQLEEIFGTCDLNSGKTLTLTEFLTSLHVSQVKQLRNRVTAKTHKPPPVVTKKVST